jgi:hypothetical protein
LSSSSDKVKPSGLSNGLVYLHPYPLIQPFNSNKTYSIGSLYQTATEIQLTTETTSPTLLKTSSTSTYSSRTSYIPTSYSNQLAKRNLHNLLQNFPTILQKNNEALQHLHHSNLNLFIYTPISADYNILHVLLKSAFPQHSSSNFPTNSL